MSMSTSMSAPLISFLLGLAFITNSAAHADAHKKRPWPWDPMAHTHWQARCTIKDSNLVLNFNSKSGDVTEDDMNVTLKIDNKPVALKIKSALYEALPVNDDLKNDCDIIPGTLISDQNFLILVSLNERPSFSRILGILIDVKKKKVLEVNDFIGSYSETDNTGDELKGLKMENIPDGFRAYLVQGYLKKSNSDGPEGELFGWKKITVNKDKISSQWEAPTPEKYNQID